jgi:hypothetical protein
MHPRGGILAGLVLSAAIVAGQTAQKPPDLSGIWQVMNTANWDIQGHAAAAGAYPQLGAIGAIPPGLGVVEGGEIPYLPEAAARKKENSANRWIADPEIKCYLPGVPRATYMPYPFQIVQSQKTILFSYEYASAVRIVNMESAKEAPASLNEPGGGTVPLKLT